MTRLIVVAISAILSAAPGQQAPRPTEEALAKAEQQARELYRADIRKAKRPAEQSELARKLLQDAVKIDDDFPARPDMIEIGCKAGERQLKRRE